MYVKISVILSLSGPEGMHERRVRAGVQTHIYLPCIADMCRSDKPQSSVAAEGDSIAACPAKVAAVQDG